MYTIHCIGTCITIHSTGIHILYYVYYTLYRYRYYYWYFSTPCPPSYSQLWEILNSAKTMTTVNQNFFGLKKRLLRFILNVYTWKLKDTSFWKEKGYNTSDFRKEFSAFSFSFSRWNISKRLTLLRIKARTEEKSEKVEYIFSDFFNFTARKML